MDYEKLRIKIKSLLIENDLKEGEFAELIGMTRQGYSKMWANTSISLDTLDKMASALKVPTWHLLADTKATVTESEDYKTKYYQAIEFIAQKLGYPNFNFVSNVAMC